MNQVRDNRGIVTFGGTTNVTNSAVGDGARVHVAATRQSPHPDRSHETRQIGIVTILPEEARAILDVLGLVADGQRFYTGTVECPAGVAKVVAAQAMGQGQQSVMATLGNLRDRYDPAVFLLVGIGGAIHDDVSINDVVVATRVVFYDRRKVIRGRTLRRGQEREAPATMVHAVNAFFTASGDPAELPGHGNEPFRVFHGPIGSGEAVVADREDEIRRYLTAYNDKTLAIEMEAGGLSQFCHETATRSGAPTSWAVIRGISDRADLAKDDRQHHSAAFNAAQALRYLIPYIDPSE